MACSGCMYMIGKDATCNQSFGCNTDPNRPSAEEAGKRKDQAKKDKSKK